jgi:nicotinamide-nucleotide amidase
MNAEIIAVGSELLTPLRVDTNSLFITGRLNEVGIHVTAKTVVGDDRENLAAVFRQAISRVPLVVVTGGLGPTDDDLTREAVSGVLGLPLEEDAAIAESIRRRFESRGLRMPDINRRQALVPRGAVALPNTRGTAPGLWIERDDRIVILLPGPPRELEPMFDAVIAERLRKSAGATRLYRRVIRISGRTESSVDQVAAPVYSRWKEWPEPIATTILAAPGEIALHLTIRSGDAAAAQGALDRAIVELRTALGDDMFSADGRSLEEVVGALLLDRGLRIAIAESCTGGLVASRLTDIAGSSNYLELGVVVYSNASKTALAGVPAQLIADHGAVSEPVAVALAAGVRARAGVDVGVGVTGIAGPGGGSEQKPVGTVVAAVSGPGTQERVRTFRLGGDRSMVKLQASQASLDMVRRALSE